MEKPVEYVTEPTQFARNFWKQIFRAIQFYHLATDCDAFCEGNCVICLLDGDPFQQIIAEFIKMFGSHCMVCGAPTEAE